MNSNYERNLRSNARRRMPFSNSTCREHSRVTWWLYSRVDAPTTTRYPTTSPIGPGGSAVALTTSSMRARHGPRMPRPMRPIQLPQRPPTDSLERAPPDPRLHDHDRTHTIAIHTPRRPRARTRCRAWRPAHTRTAPRTLHTTPAHTRVVHTHIPATHTRVLGLFLTIVSYENQRPYANFRNSNGGHRIPIRGHRTDLGDFTI